jgi:hypothetical protein
MRSMNAESELGRMTPELMLSGAAVSFGVPPDVANSPGCLSVAITARALVTIDLLIADCADIVLAEVGDSGDRSYEMTVRPIRLDTLTGAPRLTFRAIGITTAIDISPVLRLTLDHPDADQALVTSHAVGEFCLSSQTPVFTTSLPAALFTRGPDDPA